MNTCMSPGEVTYAYNPSAREAEAAEVIYVFQAWSVEWVPGQPELYTVRHYPRERENYKWSLRVQSLLQTSISEWHKAERSFWPPIPSPSVWWRLSKIVMVWCSRELCISPLMQRAAITVSLWCHPVRILPRWLTAIVFFALSTEVSDCLHFLRPGACN